jgi:mycothiol synthase
MIAVRRVESDADLEAWRQVRLSVLADERTATVDEYRRRDSPERLFLLAELEGEIAGCGFAGRSDLGHAAVAPLVLRARRRRGVGSALLAELLAHARALGFTAAGAHVDGADEPSLAFACRHGFEELDRQVEMVLSLDGPSSEPPPFDGVEFTAIADRPELLEQSYGLACEGYADLKLASGSVSVTLEEWLRDEATFPGGSFVALADAEIIGYAGLMRWPDDDARAEHGLTVVRRAWRRRGLATALKTREIAWASRNSVRELVTWTQRGNEALQGVNERLGYITRSVSVSVRRPLG